MLSFTLEGDRWRVAGTFDTGTLQQEFDRPSCKRSSLSFSHSLSLSLSVSCSIFYLSSSHSFALYRYLSLCLFVCLSFSVSVSQSLSFPLSVSLARLLVAAVFNPFALTRFLFFTNRLSSSALPFFPLPLSPHRLYLFVCEIFRARRRSESRRAIGRGSVSSERLFAL